MTRPNPTEEQFAAMVNQVRRNGAAIRNDKVERHSRGDGEATSHPSPLRKVSGSTVKPRLSSSPYKSKWDEAYEYVLVLEKRAALIRDYGYETMTLKLAKGKYHRPDYTVWHLDGTIELRQIKGYHKNIRASLTALKWAAQKHPWYRFTLWRRKGQGWESEQVAV